MRNVDGRLLGIVVALVLGSVSVAVSAGSGGGPGTSGRKEAGATEATDDRYVTVPEEDPAYRRFLRDAGGNWQARVNPASGGLRSMLGSSLKVSGDISSLDEAEDAAVRFINDYTEIFRVSPQDLRVSYRAFAAGKYSVHFSQYAGDWRVAKARVYVILTRTGELVGLAADTYPAAKAVAAAAHGAIDERVAISIAGDDIGYRPERDSLHQAERVVLPVSSGTSPGALEYRLIYRVLISVEDPHSFTETCVDAESGTLLGRRDLASPYTYVGKVTGTVDWPDRCTDSTAHYPLEDMAVRTQFGDTVYTDTNGVFSFTSTSSSVAVSNFFASRWARMRYWTSGDGEAARWNATMQGDADTLPFYWTFAQPHHAAIHERDVFAYINRAHRWFVKQFPGDHHLDHRVDCYLNENNESHTMPGRARYDSDLKNITFHAREEYPHGSDIVYSDMGRLGPIAVHEYGHMLTNYIYGDSAFNDASQVWAAVNEANSYVFPALVFQDSILGRGTLEYGSNCDRPRPPPGPWYRLENAKTYPESLVNEPPVDALILSGFYWDAGQALREGRSREEADSIVARAWHQGRVLKIPATMPDQVDATFWGDDDDEHLENGTPNYDEWCLAARNHGFDCPDVTSNFRNVATGDLASPGGQSPAWGDIDDDGDLDLYLVSLESPARLFRNDGPGALMHVSVPALEVAEGSRSASWGDYDGDGDVDLYVVTSVYCRLFRNDAGEAWADVTTPTINVGLGVSASWVDFDNDGDLDICLGREWQQAHKLFRNDGGGEFADVGGGVFGSLPSGGQAWGDYDDDGDLDVYICRTKLAMYCLPNSLFRNDGNGTFSNVTTEVLGGGARCSRDCAWGDYDSDGDLDLAVANVGGGSSMLLRNDDGTFVNVTPGCLSGYSASVAWGDMDNDGDLDLFASGAEGITPTQGRLLTNNGDDGFVDESSAALKAGRGPGCSWVDYDDDRDLDLFVAGDEYLNKLFENKLTGIDDQQLLVRAVGGFGSSPSVGARVRVWEDGVRQMREISGGRSGGHDPQEAWFGLGPWGSGGTVDSVTVTWPSGAVQRRHGVPSGVLRIGELDPDSCLVALNDSVIACPVGATPHYGTKYLEITVTLKDGDGGPLVGVPPDLVSVYVSGASRYPNKTIVFCPDSSFTVYQATEATNEYGQTIIRDSTLGGCGYIYVDSVRVGALTFATSDSAEIRSADFTGDGRVNFTDSNFMSQDLGAGCAFCGDLNYGGPCGPPPRKGQVNFSDTNKYVPHLVEGCNYYGSGKRAVTADVAMKVSPHGGIPRIEVSRVRSDAAPGKVAGSADLEARVVVEDLSPVSAIHFDLGFEPGRAEFVGVVVEDIYSDYKIWGPFVREDRNVVDLMVSTNKKGEVVSGNVLVATLRFNVSDGLASPVWLESFHTSDAQWNLDTLYSAAPGEGEPVFGLDFVGVAPNPFNPTTEIRFTTGGGGASGPGDL